MAMQCRLQWRTTAFVRRGRVAPREVALCAEGVCRQEEKAFVRLGTCVIRRMKLRPVRGEMVSFIANGGALGGAATATGATAGAGTTTTQAAWRRVQVGAGGAATADVASSVASADTSQGSAARRRRRRRLC